VHVVVIALNVDVFEELHIALRVLSTKRDNGPLLAARAFGHSRAVAARAFGHSRAVAARVPCSLDGGGESCKGATRILDLPVAIIAILRVDVHNTRCVALLLICAVLVAL
jgi:hypothetical protein